MQKTVTLPLEPLFQVLKSAGFDTSPAAQLRAWQVLDSVGRTAALHDPAALKWLLAPVFARTAEEQKRFYDLFDHYVEQVTTPQYEVVALTWKEKVALFFQTHRTGLLYVLLLALLPVLGYFIWKNWPESREKTVLPRPEFVIYKKENGQWVKFDSVLTLTPLQAAKRDFLGGGEILKNLYEGDTLLLRSTTHFDPKQDSTAYRLDWRLSLTTTDPEKGEQAPKPLANRTKTIATSSGNEWQTLLRFPKKTIESGSFSLKISHKNDTTAAQSTSYFFAAACVHPPKIPALKASKRAMPNKVISLGLATPPKKGLLYQWNITGAKGPNGQTKGEGSGITFTVDSVASIQVHLTITDTTQAAQCSTDTSWGIPVGDERVQLPYKNLEYDPVIPKKALNWASWLLLVLATLAAGWYWLRWSRRKAPKPASEATDPNPTVVETIHSDRPPYYIPYRDAAQHLRPAREQYRLADALRLRQQSEDQSLDLLATLRATLERGGYPTLRYRTRTRPTEYLFMVDEQLPGHHQARLFRHLAETLRGQDVVMEMVWYDRDLRRCWGPDLPQGVPLEQLRRYFPQHRLVLLGDGHALLDEYADTPRLRPGMPQWLNGWPQRLLLTPQPLADWNWREALLYPWFGLYPADLRGLLDAAAFVEGGLDSDDLPPTFDAWKTRQLALRAPETSTQYQQWRTLEQHDAYLAPYGSALRRWWMATAVHPDPEWEVTLAIGRALGITPTHDRLLALSRIPALHEGRLHPALRRAMLLQLPPDDEIAARRAVLDELEAVQHLTEGSHVGTDTRHHIAIQAFLLQPQDPDRQTALAALLAAGALTRTQVDELNLFAAKAVPLLNNNQPNTRGDIREWLAQHAPEPATPIQPKRPFYTPDFWKALACTALLVLLGIGAWGLLRTPAAPLDPAYNALKTNPFVRETWAVDSAVLIHNIGVGQGNTRLFQKFDLPRADSLLTRAIALRGGAYLLAELNRSRNLYNIGVTLLENRRSTPNQLTEATTYFDNAAARSVDTTTHRDAIHGAGVAHFYAYHRDSALLRYKTLFEVGYFDTLSLRPNLQTILAGAPTTPAAGTDRDGDGTPDATDGCPDDRNKTAPGPCPCGVPNTDTDGDGIADCKDKCPNQPAPNTPDGCTPPPPDPAAILADIERSMIRVPGGKFRMGSDEKDEDAYSSEKPVREVTLRDFYMGRTEVTNVQYAAFLNEKGNQSEGDVTWINLKGSIGGEKCRIQSTDDKTFTVEKGYEQHPVIYVSWYGVTAYCNWLSQKTRKNYRLPTEAEWEYAARGGSKWTDGYKYAGSNTIDEVAWYDKNSYDKGEQSPDYGTHVVATKKANQLGLYDMSGNVWEWCEDDWHDNYEGAPTDGSAWFEKGNRGEYRVFRGGGWFFNARLSRSANRGGSTPTFRNYNIGFRLVLQ
jgi:formylglycine-generating enzyme required for sulfatase activity